MTKTTVLCSACNGKKFVNGKRCTKCNGVGQVVERLDGDTVRTTKVLNEG